MRNGKFIDKERIYTVGYVIFLDECRFPAIVLSGIIM